VIGQLLCYQLGDIETMRYEPEKMPD